MARSELPVGNAAIGQSGGPTAVINQSLFGCVSALRSFKSVKKILGMRHGVNGVSVQFHAGDFYVFRARAVTRSRCSGVLMTRNTSITRASGSAGWTARPLTLPR